MNAQIEDFWPTDIAVDMIVTPVAILREQASMLAGKTKGLVEGRVSTQPGQNNRIHHSFELVAPALGGYRYELFSVSHSALLYPVRVENDSTIPTTVPLMPVPPIEVYLFTRPKELSSENEFKDWLRGVLSSQHTKQVVNSLLAQSSEAK